MIWTACFPSTKHGLHKSPFSRLSTGIILILFLLLSEIISILCRIVPYWFFKSTSFFPIGIICEFSTNGAFKSITLFDVSCAPVFIAFSEAVLTLLILYFSCAARRGADIKLSLIQLTISSAGKIRDFLMSTLKVESNSAPKENSTLNNE